MASLRVLLLSHNRLTVTPAGIGKLGKLNTVHLSYNQLGTVLPPEFGALTSLVSLELEGNSFVRPPPIVIDQGCEVLIEYLSRVLEARSSRLLFMDNMKLPFFPPEMMDMPTLTGLSMADNQLEELDPVIGTFTCLTALHLDRNRLTLLPSSVGNLTRLGKRASECV
ncbi:hypothetical protein T484DRAFT_1805618 [Baffinella frigidus]|nr:hypothetical protein T484DRAFT_1805618 [Cryptophyta sp. CCMP2293]